LKREKTTFQRFRFSSDADIVRLTNACIIIVINITIIIITFLTGRESVINGLVTMKTERSLT